MVRCRKLECHAHKIEKPEHNNDSDVTNDVDYQLVILQAQVSFKSFFILKAKMTTISIDTKNANSALSSEWRDNNDLADQ